MAGTTVTVRGMKPASAASPVGSKGAIAATKLVNGQAIVTTALKYLGVRYVGHGSSPATGFDDVGFVQYVYATQGIKLHWEGEYGGAADCSWAEPETMAAGGGLGEAAGARRNRSGPFSAILNTDTPQS